MVDLQLFLTGLLAFLLVDFLLEALRTAFMQTNHARLLALREHMEAEVSRTSSLLLLLPLLKASLDLSQLLVRFLLAGMVMWFISRQPFTTPLLVGLGGLLLTAFLVFWFELVVERVVSRDAEHWALRLTPLARGLLALFSVLLALPFAFTRGPRGVSEPVGSVTEDELKTLVDAGQEEGVFELGERRMIYSIFELGDTLVREIMVPRIDMLALDVSTPLVEAVDALLESGHSRVPVYEETVDKTLGLLYAKDLLRVWREGNRLDTLRALLRPAYFVPEAKKVDELLAEMQSQRVHMAIVVDEYGGVAGLVTLEDIVEEILGEIQDEYDQGEESPYQVLKNGDYIFLGRVDLDDFNEITGGNLPKDEADTLGGYIYSRIGRVPDVGEMIRKDNLQLTVEQVSARRIRKVRARWVPAQPERGEA